MHYYMFNKPYGCVTARRDERYPVVMDYFRELHNNDLSPVGRLDRETEGLLFVTDDGAWNQSLIHPANHIAKTYEFTAMGELDKEKICRIQNGICLSGMVIPTAPAEISVLSQTTLASVLPELHPEIRERILKNRPDQPVIRGTITITEGRKRQIRRMLKAVGCYVIFLKRISIGDFVLDKNLQSGEWKEIRPHFP